jgi:hypothetical protein
MVNSSYPGESGSSYRAARRATNLTLVLALLCGAPAIADEIKLVDMSHTSSGLPHFFDVFNPYASLEYAYDSNIFRLDNRQPSIGSRADRYTTVDVGFNSDIKEGQQRFLLDGVYSPVSYAEHNVLNYEGGKFGAVWHWAESPALTGVAGYRFTRSLRDFANQLAPSRVKDVRDEQRFFGSGDWNVVNNWVWGVRAEYADITFDSTPTLDLHKSTAGTSLTYVSRAGNELVFDLEDIHGTYTDNSGSSFDQYTVGPTLKWKYTVRTELDATVAYSSRRYTGTGGPFRGQRPSYSGPVANVVLTIADAGRGSFKAAAYQEVSNLTDEIPDYAVVDGLSLEPGWTLSNGIVVSLRGVYEHRDFRAATGSLARQDDIGTFTGILDWPIGRHWKFTASTTTEKRSSTRYLQGYQFLLQKIQITGTL